MEDLTKQFMEDAAEIPAPTDQELMVISKLAVDQKDYERQIAKVTSDLEELQKKHKEISERLLPDAMAKVGMKQFTLLNGQTIIIKDEVFSSVRADHALEAYAWLDEMGIGDVVKNDVVVAFGRGKEETATQLVEFCKKQGFNVERKQSIHASTLKALVKEQMGKGLVFPEEFFSIHPYKKAIIK